jgi:ribosome recycling factor
MVRPFDPKLVGDIVAAIIADDAKLNVIPDGYDAWLLFLRGRIISFAT